jgi:hypothetical protein
MANGVRRIESLSIPHGHCLRVTIVVFNAVRVATGMGYFTIKKGLEELKNIVLISYVCFNFLPLVVVLMACMSGTVVLADWCKTCSKSVKAASMGDIL